MGFATREKFVQTAMEEIGYLEKASNRNLESKTANAGFNNFTKYGAWYGDNGAYWCQQYVSWVAFMACGGDREAGKRLLCGAYTEYTPTGKSLFVKAGRWYTVPEVGDVVYFYSPSMGRVSHVGIVTAVNRQNKTFLTVEGNTSSGNIFTRNGGCVATHNYSYAHVGGGNRVNGFGRPQFATSSQAVSLKAVAPAQKTWLERGDKGEAVRDLQAKLIVLGYSVGSAGADGDFGGDTESAVRAFQQACGLMVDGQAGKNTMSKLNAMYSAKVNQGLNSLSKLTTTLQLLIDAKADGKGGPETVGKSPTLRIGTTGEVVEILQRLLQDVYKIGVIGGIDGDFGDGTYRAVIEFQRQKGLKMDGVVGKATWRALLQA